MNRLRTLIDYYTKHIKKEDDVFFHDSRTYFSEEEDKSKLAEFWEFDRKMIHEKYTSAVKEFETRLISLFPADFLRLGIEEVIEP